jgi:hypothetical protein
MEKAKNPLRVCFDIETEAFSRKFESARTTEGRLRHAPKMRIACAFDGTKWTYYLPSDAAALIQLLEGADEVITFNGMAFDELVLRKHHKLPPRVLADRKKHIDLYAIIKAETNRSVSLHRLARENLGEPKHTKGRQMANLDIEALKVACRSDVWQTYRLWEMWARGSINIPIPNIRSHDGTCIGPGHHMPTLCPSCHAVGTVELLEHDMDDMSDGQLSDYLAGLYGSAYCDACEFHFDWGF